MKDRQFIRCLKKAGAEIISGRGKGGHVLAKHQGRQTTIPIHGGKDLSPVFMKMVCKQLGLDPKDVL